MMNNNTMTSVHTHVKSGTEAAAASKTKEDPLKNPPHDVSGIANAITCISMSGTSLIWLLEGDRHFWPEGVKAAWASHFFPKGGSFKGAPFQVYTVTAALVFLGKTYDAAQQAHYILAHMLSKGWAPVACFEDEAAATLAVAAAKAKQTVSVSQEKLLALHAMLMDFTMAVAGHHYHEIVMGAVEGGPTTDAEAIEETLKKETEEEAGLVLESGQATFKEWAKPYTSRKTGKTSTTAIFQTPMRKEHMEDIWRRADALRRPKGFTGWRCPHAWYKTIPGIDLAAAEYEKARQETRNGAWYDVQDALNKPDFMDKKNVDVVKTLLGI